MDAAKFHFRERFLIRVTVTNGRFRAAVGEGGACKFLTATNGDMADAVFEAQNWCERQITGGPTSFDRIMELR